MKWHSSVEALYALIFALCILAALFLLTGCGGNEAPRLGEGPLAQAQSVVFPAKGEAGGGSRGQGRRQG